MKWYLDAWKRERSEATAQAPDTPPMVVSKGNEFACTVWALVSREAQRDVQQLKSEAHAEVSSVRSVLVAASTEIARLTDYAVQAARLAGEAEACR